MKVGRIEFAIYFRRLEVIEIEAEAVRQCWCHKVWERCIFFSDRVVGMHRPQHGLPRNGRICKHIAGCIEASGNCFHNRFQSAHQGGCILQAEPGLCAGGLPFRASCRALGPSDFGRNQISHGQGEWTPWDVLGMISNIQAIQAGRCFNNTDGILILVCDLLQLSPLPCKNALVPSTHSLQPRCSV